MAKISITYADALVQCPEATKAIAERVALKKQRLDRMCWQIGWHEPGEGWDLPGLKGEYPTVEAMVRFRVGRIKIMALHVCKNGSPHPYMTETLTEMPPALLDNLRRETKEELF